MSRPRTQYGIPLQPPVRSSTYTYARTSNVMPTATSTNVTTLTKGIHSRNINVSTGNNNRIRTKSRFDQISPERTTTRTNLPSIQRRLSSQDRSVSFY
jgi:hypothetical protein